MILRLLTYAVAGDIFHGSRLFACRFEIQSDHHALVTVLFRYGLLCTSETACPRDRSILTSARSVVDEQLD